MAEQFEEGQKLTWLYTQRGGYGFQTPVLARFVAYTKGGKAIIDVQTVRGVEVRRRVDPTNLRPRQEGK